MQKASTLNGPELSKERLESLQTMANRLRRHSLLSTTQAASGHPSSCFSCAELVAAVFFQFLRYDTRNPDYPGNDRFVLSKGHAAPILWAAWAEAGGIPVEDLQTLREIDSDLEGHPTPRNPLIDVATGSLGQGLSNALGMAFSSRLSKIHNRTYVVIGDGESAEGSVWEAAALASFYGLDNLTAILDVNRLGQSEPTMIQHHLEQYEARWKAFGWNTLLVDGHDVSQVVTALTVAHEFKGAPSILIARTIKGKGVSFMEDKEGWHGKAVTDKAELQQALREIGENLELKESLTLAPPPTGVAATPQASQTVEPPSYGDNDEVATRQAYGTGLRRLGASNPNVVVLDGDTKNSTFSEKFKDAYPERFIECFIAEQNMVGVAAGLASVGKRPFASTFACFLTRAFDFIRMAAISQADMTLCGSHAGISIGEDGPSQMALEDLAMMRSIHGSTIFYPSDAVSTERLVALAASQKGISYIRTSRPKTPILYTPETKFRVGGSQVLRSSPKDQATVVSAGVTLHEALAAYEALKADGILIRVIDLYSVKPVDEKTLQAAASETGRIITVEDHYPEGGLGEAVQSAVANSACKIKKLAVTGLPRSGKSEELLDKFGISRRHIVEAVKSLQ